MRTLNRKTQVAWVTGTLALGGIAVAGGAQAFSGGHDSGSQHSDRVTNVASQKNGEHADGNENGENKNKREAMCARLDADVAKAIAAAKSPQAGKVTKLANGDVVVPLQAVHLYRCPAGTKPPVTPPSTTPPVVTQPAPSTNTQPPASSSTTPPPAPSTSTAPPAPSTTTPPPAPSTTKPPVTTPPPAPSTTKPPVSTTTPPVVTSTGS
jgi:hypothetical protein